MIALRAREPVAHRGALVGSGERPKDALIAGEDAEPIAGRPEQQVAEGVIAQRHHRRMRGMKGDDGLHLRLGFRRGSAINLGDGIGR
jgi:hypothetical protein